MILNFRKKDKLIGTLHCKNEETFSRFKPLWQICYNLHRISNTNTSAVYRGMFQEISGIFSTSNVCFLLTFCRVEVLTSSSFFVLLRPKRNPVCHDLNSPNSKSSHSKLVNKQMHPFPSKLFRTVPFENLWGAFWLFHRVPVRFLVFILSVAAIITTSILAKSNTKRCPLDWHRKFRKTTENVTENSKIYAGNLNEPITAEQPRML